MKRGWMAVIVAMLSAACAAPGGPPSPVEHTMVATDAGQATPQQIAAQIERAAGDFALVIAPQESAWFSQLAAASGLGLSGPADTGDLGLAFLSRLELLGDTSMVLGGDTAQLHLQDALYQIEEERFLDLMLVRVPENTDLRAAVRNLLEYIATDVMANASVVLGVTAATAADAQEVESLLRAAFSNAAECADLSNPESRTYRVFFGPVARMRCTDARQLDGPGAPIVARLSVGLQQ